jgi:hypothetical protein
MVLFWNQNDFVHTIPANPILNIALLHFAPEFDTLHEFCSTITATLNVSQTRLVVRLQESLFNEMDMDFTVVSLNARTQVFFGCSSDLSRRQITSKPKRAYKKNSKEFDDQVRHYCTHAGKLDDMTIIKGVGNRKQCNP